MYRSTLDSSSHCGYIPMGLASAGRTSSICLKHMVAPGVVSPRFKVVYRICAVVSVRNHTNKHTRKFTHSSTHHLKVIVAPPEPKNQEVLCESRPRSSVLPLSSIIAAWCGRSSIQQYMHARVRGVCERENQGEGRVAM